MAISKFESFIWAVAALTAIFWMSFSAVVNNSTGNLGKDYGFIFALPAFLCAWLIIKGVSRRGEALSVLCFILSFGLLTIWLTKTVGGLLL
jgi:hypothetical protein